MKHFTVGKLVLWVTPLLQCAASSLQAAKRKTEADDMHHSLKNSLIRLLCGAALTVLPPLHPAWSQGTAAEARLQSWEHHVTLRDESKFKHLEWRSVGPRKQGGRIESIACPPGNTSVMRVGVGSGSLWKTVNNGITWKPIFEHESTCAIGVSRFSQSGCGRRQLKSMFH